MHYIAVKKYRINSLVKMMALISLPNDLKQLYTHSITILQMRSVHL